MKRLLETVMILVIALAARAELPNWGEPVTDSYSMNLACNVSLDGEQIAAAEGSVLSVWTPEGVLAGKGEAVDGIMETRLFMLTVFASEPERAGFTLRVYDSAAGIVYSITDEINFINGGEIGNIIEPFTFTAVAELPQYSVVFDAGEHGTIVSGEASQLVYEGQDAVEPEIAADNPYLFAGWDADVTNVSQDVYATALYYKPTGEGTPQNPYRISNVSGLGAAEQNPAASFLLVRNIDLTGIVFREAPIAAHTPFTGSFNGAGHRITGLTIEGAYTNGGLFGVIGEGGEVKNLSIEHASVSSVLNAGALAGINAGSIKRCSSQSGLVTGAYYAGGLAGHNLGTIAQSFSTGDVIGTITDTGGLVGLNEGIISHCYSARTVKGKPAGNNGGLVGRARDTAATENSFWDMDTSGLSNSAGGLGLLNAAMHKKDTFANAGWDFENDSEDGTEDDWTMETSSGLPGLARFAGAIPDIDGDGKVNASELKAASDGWLACECGFPKWCDGADVNRDGKIDLADLSILAADWL